MQVVHCFQNSNKILKGAGAEARRIYTPFFNPYSSHGGR
jgi:hypothetical protein